MKAFKEENGWVIYHKESEYLFVDSFERTKPRCIANFISGTGLTWIQWKKKYNYVCVRAKRIIQLI